MAGRRKAARQRDWDALVVDVAGALFVAAVLTLLLMAIINDNTRPDDHPHNSQRAE